jgi:hypothetical protein
MAIFKTNYPVPDPNVYGINSTTKPKPGTIFPSAVRGVASYNSPDLWNPWAVGVRLYIDITNNTGNTGTVTVKIQVKDPVSGNYVDVALATTTAIATTGTSILTVYPSANETANVDVSDPLGLNWRVVATVGTANCTFSVGAEYLI